VVMLKFMTCNPSPLSECVGRIVLRLVGRMFT
jgi:hypothetical protein